MFPAEVIPDYCSGIAMSNGAENWFYNQIQYPVDPQYSSNTGVIPTEYNHYNFMLHQNFYNEGNVTHQELNVPLPVNNYQYIPLTPEPVTPPGFHLPTAAAHDMIKPIHLNVSVVRPHDGVTKTIKKRKRTRTAFTTEQIEALEEIYKKKQYITRIEREVIVQQLQLSDKPVKTWFQNRRLKSKRESEQIEEEQEERFVPNTEQVESVQNQLTPTSSVFSDDVGQATLDDSFIRDLFDVTEEYMASNVANVNYEDIGVIEAPPMYEPISPASDSGSNDNDNYLNWEPAEPDESIRFLSELQVWRAL